MNELLTVIFDLSNEACSNLQSDSLKLVLQSVTALTRAHRLLSSGNDISLITTSFEKSEIIYTPSTLDGNIIKVRGNEDIFEESVLLEKAIENCLQRNATFIANESSSKTNKDSSNDNNNINNSRGTFSASLSMSLCLTNRWINAHKQLDKPTSRILVVHSSDIDATQYIGTMNGIFCAQKLSVPIDACICFGEEVPFLQQATSITGGVYSHPSLRDIQTSLLQILLLNHLPDSQCRELLRVPTQNKVDFRASCLCHKKMMSVGYVCSVCLSLFCERTAACAACGSAFGRE
mmetsp:Transcript_19368/g.33298  ORF Transcript_19368/g.33298 Transcript_19368/m.33298 type:complete len:291 (-) Transcript_19368:377-1249(-)